ncbi:acyltransferase family protein [Duganella aceris]|uniref:Acyltransferase n=1 Tax=Duganella aceris TaxID=2703883 RepID=A0ABX0FPR5_9BURK|nr:acyltransferase [Duganella aceris]NGZ86525.1 acyltransferase [Duganella aceris]
MRSLNLPYNPRIDQLRWLAATIVFLYHFYVEYCGAGGAAFDSVWAGIITEGHTGVGLFFTLSGFLFMQIALAHGQLEYRDFVRNRTLRIVPLFFTIFLLATSIGRDKFQGQDIFYLLATNLGSSPTSVSVVTGAAWCISLEFLFYLVFPFLSRFAIEQGPRYLLKLLVLMMFFKLVSYNENEHSTIMYFSTFVGRFDQFIIGMLAAMLYQQRQVLLRRLSLWLAPLALMLACANSALQAHLAPFNVQPKSIFWISWSMQESLVWACMIVAWVSFPRLLPAWLECMLCHGGKISFSFYLLHMAVIHFMFRAVGPLHISGQPLFDTLLFGVMLYAATWALGTLSYHVVEEPFLNMRRRYGAARNA